LTDPTPWKKFTVYRRVPRLPASIHVTLALTGIGTVYFDKHPIEPLVPGNTPGAGQELRDLRCACEWCTHTPLPGRWPKVMCKSLTSPPSFPAPA